MALLEPLFPAATEAARQQLNYNYDDGYDEQSSRIREGMFDI